MSEFIKHAPCNDCTSSDGMAVYDDHTFCFVCNEYHSLTNEDYDMPVQGKVSTNAAPNGTAQAIPIAIPKAIADRGIGSATVKFYGVLVSSNQHSYPYCNADGVVVAHKYRQLADKRFSSDGDIKNALLFGQHLFSAKGRYVTLTEGELDAMAAFQMLGSKYPVVSIKNGAAAALRDCKAQYEWLDSFENIIISFDSDAPGKQAAKQVAELFGPHKCKIVTLSKYKDACDYLSKGDSKAYVEQWWAASPFVPDGIVAGDTLWDTINKPVDKAQVLYPWDGLNALTYGIRLGELVTVTAGSGLGKSLFLREVVYHILKMTEDKIGLLFMEESVYKTARSIMSISLNKPLHLPDTVVDESEMRNAFNDTLGTGKLYLFDHFGSMNIDNIISRVRYMAKALDCKFIILDHISILVSDQQHGDERKYLDEVMTKLRTVVQELNIALLCVSHLKRPDGRGHEDGAATSLSQLRGSGSIAQLSDMVIGLERHAQADDAVERNTTHVRVLKNRLSGLTGECTQLHYNQYTGRMVEAVEAL